MHNRQRFMVEVLALLLTVITLTLGGLMYFSNAKNTRQNLIGVELADFIYNINYSMQFGKKIETFYGMQENLEVLQDSIEDVDGLHILSAENNVLFSTDREMLPERVASMTAGSNVSDREHLYCMYAINDDARILTVSGISSMRQELRKYLLRLIGIAAVGFVLVLVLIRIIWKVIPDRKSKGDGLPADRRGLDWRRAYRLAAAVTTLWIVAFSVMTGVDTYREYAGSMEMLCDHIGASVKADIQKVEEMGIPREELYGIEDYLERYTDLIPEVEELGLREDDTVSYKMSESYRRKMYIDYILQTVLLLTFSILVMAEYQLFITNTGTLTEGEQNGTD